MDLKETVKKALFDGKENGKKYSFFKTEITGWNEDKLLCL